MRDDLNWLSRLNKDYVEHNLNRLSLKPGEVGLNVFHGPSFNRDYRAAPIDELRQIYGV